MHLMNTYPGCRSRSCAAGAYGMGYSISRCCVALRCRHRPHTTLVEAIGETGVRASCVSNLYQIPGGACADLLRPLSGMEAAFFTVTPDGPIGRNRPA